MLDRVIEADQSTRRLVACAALSAGVLVAALTQERSVELAPLLAIGLALAYGICKSNTL